MFSSWEFQRVEELLGIKFTFDAACNVNGSSALCSRFASPADSFFSKDVAGECVWINSPYTHIREWQEHYARCKDSNPAGTSAVFCVPAWSQVQRLMQSAGYRLVKTYEAGTKLVSRPSSDGSRIDMDGTPWAVQLWHDPPRELATLRWLEIEQGATCPLTFAARLAEVNCTVLIDTGAKCAGKADGYISRKLVQTIGLYMHEAPLLSVRVANSQRATIVGLIRTVFRIKRFRDDIQLLVLEQDIPGVDMVLSLDWLSKRRALIDVAAGSVELRKGLTCTKLHAINAVGNEVTATVHAMGTDDFQPMSAKHAARRLCKGARAFLAMVQPDTTQDATPVETAAPDQPTGLMADNALQALLDEFKEVFDQPKDPKDTDAGHVIPLISGATPPSKRSYRLTQNEQAEVKRQVTELLAKGFIQPSKSPYGAPVIFVKKADGSLRMAFDYRALNKITVKRRYPMPNITDLFDKLAGATLFSSLDLQQGYNQIRIAPEDVEKTAFIAPGMGQFEWKVLCFGLTNAPATFQQVMNNTFGARIGEFVLVYLDDILVFSRTPQEHEAHLRSVLNTLKEKGFKAKLSKCQFNRPELHFLGHVVSRHGLKVDQRKVEVIRNWPVPTDLHKLRAFLGLANYFRRFIQGYSSLVAPLTSLTRAKVAWHWDDTCQAAFEGVKQALTNAPVLKLPELDKPFTVWSDASVHGTGAVLLQEERPVAYTSAKFNSAEYNYTTTDQECLGTVRALEEWRCYLEGATQVTLVTDHQPLVYLQGQQRAEQLSRRQARWMEKLSRFQVDWEYRPGRINVADPLSRMYEPGMAEPSLAVLDAVLCVVHKNLARGDLGKAILDGYLSDLCVSDQEQIAKWRLRKTAEFWYRGAQVYVPPGAVRAALLHEYHDAPTSGHRGRDRTLHAISQHYWWPNMHADVKTHVQTCLSCQKNKPSNDKPGGTLKPLPIPKDVWESVSVDLITQLPQSKHGHDAIVVFVDRLSKMTHFAPTHTTVTAEGMAQLFVNTIFRLHGLPTDIVSDRDSKFTSVFWKELHRLLGTNLYMSTAFHPQSDGQTERMNRVLEETLRHYISPTQDDWEDHLPLIEFAINNSKQRSTGHTPFALNYAKAPRVPTDITLKSRAPSAQQYAQTMQERLAKAKANLQTAQARQKSDADKHRRPVEYRVGQEVLLNTVNIKFRGAGTKKLTPRWVGPYRIIELVGPVAVKLQLPKSSRIHPVFHVALVKPFRSNGSQPPPEPFTIEGEPTLTVEAVRAHKDESVRGGSGRTRREYLVKWEKLGEEQNTWETEKSLRATEVLGALVDAYEAGLPAAHRNQYPVKQVNWDEVRCVVCNMPEPEDTMVLCSKCNKGYHMACMTPPLVAVPKGRWYCSPCQAAQRAKRPQAKAPQAPPRRSKRLRA